ncbi:hypothetical protein AJ80_05732 [Polytolypa hystricis UAMH7299]|uniref:EKC/KEOPS complex subunit BUD32 n=1 Tax=Polytolypa hystricis (strain UAMH7299) TaxID=1447883 RepID=A0A2B7Y1C4_POLH7|nr:hypothetical protein AJ80_05732 [Polytolypa hystricis UAMH7299]
MRGGEHVLSIIPPHEPIEHVSKVSYLSLQNELTGCVLRHVKGFYAKYFEDQSWSIAANQIVQKVQPTLANGLGIDFLEIRSRESLSAWLTRFHSFLNNEEKIHSHFRSQQISNSDDPLRASICLVASDQPKSSPSTIAHARVLGEFNANASNTDSEDVLRFCESSRQVVEAEPTRRFLHGFQICRSMMELWVFDRSGAYSGEMLDLEQRPDLLIKAIASYAMMNDEEVGLDSFIRLDGLGSYVAFNEVDGNEVEKFYLDHEPIAAPQYIVGPGTTCYSARKLTSKTPEVVVMFAWREDKRHTERELLELTKERNVWGVIKVLGSQDLESIESLRQGLQFNQPFNFLPIVPEADERATYTDSSEKYEQSFVNRTFSCIMTSPLGTPINKFQSVLEFLEACRDVVKALRSLYQDGKLLHRDICIKNLIIALQCNEGDAMGVLIDLDMALDLEKGPARKGELIGSEGFMAIGILTGDAHTYRHDLESLFYVFLWVAICNDRDHDDQESLRYQPKASRLWGWCSMDFRSVARNKAVDMMRSSPDGFFENSE